MIAAVTPLHDAPFTGRGAWRRADFATPEAWTHHLSSAALSELESALRRIRASSREISTLSLADFPAPSFAPAAEGLRGELESGRGFVVIRGLPIDRYSSEEAAIVYWGIAARLAIPIPQNAKDEYLFSVRDEGYN